MVHLQQIKHVVFHSPATVASNATSFISVDTLGADYAIVKTYLNPTAATNTSAKWLTLQLMHGTSTDVSNHTAVAKAVGTTNATATTNQFVLQQHNNTSNPQITAFAVDLRTKERYLGLQRKAANTANLTWSEILLGRLTDGPNSTGDWGVASFVTC